MSDVTITEATGVPAAPNPEIDQFVAVIGTAETGDDTAFSLASTNAVADEYTAGPMPRRARHLIGRTRRAVCTVRAATDTPGDYETIDLSAFTGTAEPAARASSVPNDYYQAYWRIIDAGTVGTTGITYYESRDDGRTLSGLKRLGTATFLEIAGTNVIVDLDPPEAALVAYVVDLRQETIDHFALTSGGVHGTADATSGTGITSAPTDFATARACMVSLKAAALLHVVNISSSIHGAADTTAQTALTAIAITGSSTNQQVLTAALAYKAAMFGTGTANSGHTIRTTSSIHGAADATNVITATTPTTGTLVAGDIIRLTTVAPTWSTTTLADAFAELLSSQHAPGLILIAGTAVPGDVATISTGLDNLAAVGKDAEVILEGRPRDTLTETELQWVNNLIDEWANVADRRISVCAGDYYCTFTDGQNAYVYEINFGTQYTRRLADIPRRESPIQTTQGPLLDVAMVNSAGVLIGHDEELVPGLRDGRFVALKRLLSQQFKTGVYVDRPLVMRGSADRVFQVQVGRVTDAIRRAVLESAMSLRGKGLAVIDNPNVPGTKLLRDDARDIATKVIANAVRLAVSHGGPDRDDITDPLADDLVVVDTAVTVDGDDVNLDNVTVNYTPFKAVGRVSVTISIRV